MTMIVARAIAGGVLIAVVQIAAERAEGTRIAGLLLLFPAVTLVGLAMLWAGGRTQDELAGIATTSVAGILAVIAFLVALAALLQRGMPFVPAAGLALVAWTIGAGAALAWTS